MCIYIYCCYIFVTIIYYFLLYSDYNVLKFALCMNSIGLEVWALALRSTAWQDLNDGQKGFGIMTNEPEYPWQVQAVQSSGRADTS